MSETEKPGSKEPGGAAPRRGKGGNWTSGQMRKVNLFLGIPKANPFTLAIFARPGTGSGIQLRGLWFLLARVANAEGLRFECRIDYRDQRPRNSESDRKYPDKSPRGQKENRYFWNSSRVTSSLPSLATSCSILLTAISRMKGMGMRFTLARASSCQVSSVVTGSSFWDS